MLGKCRVAPLHRQEGDVLGITSGPPFPVTPTCVSLHVHSALSVLMLCELETLVPTNSSQEIHIRRPCSASSRPLPTCSCSALRGVCGSTSHCHHSASASLTHKQGDTEHRCGELSGQVLGADLPDSHKGRSCEGCGGPSASLRAESIQRVGALAPHLSQATTMPGWRTFSPGKWRQHKDS